MTVGDIGGPSGAGGLPLEEASSLNLQNDITNRSVVDHGTRNESVEGFEPVELESDADAEEAVVRLIFSIELDDLMLTGQEDAEESLIFVSKPPLLRKSNFDTDGDFIDGVKIEYTADGTRTRTLEDVKGGELILLEKIDPPYIVGAELFAAVVEDTGISSNTLQDLNLDGRKWVNILPRERYFQIVEINRDTFWGQEWDFSTNAQKLDSTDVLLPRELIAKPHLMRGSYWDNLVVSFIAAPPNGVLPQGASADAVTLKDLTYTVTDFAAVLPDPEENEYTIRDVDIDGQDAADDGNETQDIIPRWWPGVTIIRAELSEDGTGAFRTVPGEDKLQAVWQDQNDGAHAFAEAFA